MSRGATWSREQITHDELVRQVVEFYNRLPSTFAYSTHNDRYPPLEAGIPDVCVHIAGATSYREVKLPDDRIRPAQALFAALAQRAGIEVRIVSSPDDICRGGKLLWPTQIEKLLRASSANATTPTGTKPARSAASKRRSRKR